MNLSDLLADEVIERQIALLRFDASVRREVLKVLARLDRELVARLATKNLARATRERLTKELRAIRTIIDEFYVEATDRFGERMVEMAGAEADWLSGRINKAVGTRVMVALPPKSTLRQLATEALILGAPTSEWWRRQSADTAFRFAAAVRQGAAEGETSAQIVTRVRADGVLGLSRRNAEALVRTSVQSIANATRMQTLIENEGMVKGVQQVSTLDNRTTEICIAYSGATWDLDGKPIGKTKLQFNGGPPRHWNCRSTLVPVLKSWRDMGIDVDEFKPAARASVDGEVASDLTFTQWLKGKSSEFQDELLGRGKADLWRRGKISLQQLLDQTGRPLTLAQLQRRYG